MLDNAEFQKNIDDFINKYRACTLCELHDTNDTGVILYRSVGDLSKCEVLFICNSIRREDSDAGYPLQPNSDAGQLLDAMSKEAGIVNYSVTAMVGCRSWGYAYNSQGVKIMRENRRTHQMEPLIKDEPPCVSHLKACRARVNDFIYLIDPTIIVALGHDTLESLGVRVAQQGAANITTLTVPGRAYVPNITERGVWGRSIGSGVARKFSLPIIQNKVAYPLLPIASPLYALDNYQDQRPGSPMSTFVEGFKTLGALCRAYRKEASNV